MDKALAGGEIRRVAKGVYALPKAPSALTAARSHGGVESYTSAAKHWGMDVIVPAAGKLRGPHRRVRGWTLLRFSWEDIMYDPDWVVQAVLGLPALTNQLTQAA